jgi:hypothetical protein
MLRGHKRTIFLVEFLMCGVGALLALQARPSLCCLPSVALWHSGTLAYDIESKRSILYISLPEVLLSATAMSGQGLSNTLQIYRRLLTLARSFPDPAKRLRSITQLQEAFRNNSNESDTEKIRDMLVKAQSTLSYLKIVTPRSASHEQTMHTKVDLGDDSGAKRSSKAVSNWTGSNMDPDSVARHAHTLKVHIDVFLSSPTTLLLSFNHLLLLYYCLLIIFYYTPIYLTVF